jgi:hypothetical protein
MTRLIMQLAPCPTALSFLRLHWLWTLGALQATEEETARGSSDTERRFTHVQDDNVLHRPKTSSVKMHRSGGKTVHWHCLSTSRSGHLTADEWLQCRSYCGGTTNNPSLSVCALCAVGTDRCNEKASISVTNSDSSRNCLKTKFRGLNPRANYTDRVIATC